MADEYQYYRDALAGRKPEIDASSPQPGNYKLRRYKNGPWLPVAIWSVNGKLVARVAKDAVDPYAIWTWCADKPIDKDVAKEVFRTGIWPGDVDVAPVGHNAPPAEPETLVDQIAEYIGKVRDWLSGTKTIAAQDQADMAANYRSELARLKKAAEEQHKTEKAPHLEAGRAVDAKYKPIISDIDDATKSLRDLVGAFLAAEEKRQREEARKQWEAEQKAAREKQAIIDAERAKLMEVDPIAALTEPEPEPVELPPPPEPIKVHAGGQRGKRTGLKTETVYIVTDARALALALIEMGNEDLIAGLEKLAGKLGRAGVIPPGVEKQERRVAA